MRSARPAAIILAMVVAAACVRESDWAEVDGGRLYYEQSGAGPDVVLIHGFSLDTRMWEPQAEALAEHFRITRYDVRGFGRSSAAPLQHDAVADLLGLMDDLGIQRAHIVGMSMGGAIATDFALTHPGRVSSLALIGGDVNGFPHTDWERFEPLFEAGARGDLMAAKALWLQYRSVSPVKHNPSIARSIRDMVMDCPCQHFADIRFLPRAASPPAFQRLEEIKAPALAIVGALDEPATLEIADAVATRVRGGRKLVIPEAGHLVNFEQAAAVNRALLEFWKGTLPAEPAKASE